MGAFHWYYHGAVMTVSVSIEEVRRLRARIEEINSIPLDQIVWTLNDNVVMFSEEAIAEWKYVGLSNMYFIEHVMDS